VCQGELCSVSRGGGKEARSGCCIPPTLPSTFTPRRAEGAVSICRVRAKEVRAREDEEEGKGETGGEERPRGRVWRGF